MDRKQKTEKILDAALTIFAEKGFKKTTVEDIASSLNMTKGNLYLYARDKQDLYNQAVIHGLRRWKEYVMTSLSDISDVVEQFIAAHRFSYEYLALDLEMRNIIVNDPNIFPVFPDKDEFEAVKVQAREIVERILERGVLEGRFRKDVQVGDLALFIYNVYIIFINKTYIRDEAEVVQKMFSAAHNVFLKGLLVPDNPLNKKYLDHPVQVFHHEVSE
jgi:AcrR family transcriptional regulator